MQIGVNELHFFKMTETIQQYTYSFLLRSSSHFCEVAILIFNCVTFFTYQHNMHREKLKYITLTVLSPTCLKWYKRLCMLFYKSAV